MELPINIEYFEKKTSIISEDVCRHIIDKNYDFGFIAQIGENKINKTPDFILCNLHPTFEEINITLISSNTNVGKQLLELVYQKGRELKYRYLSLFFIGEIKLVNWYKKLGFVVISEKPIPKSKIKAHCMRKLL